MNSRFEVILNAMGKVTRIEVRDVVEGRHICSVEAEGLLSQLFEGWGYVEGKGYVMVMDTMDFLNWLSRFSNLTGHSIDHCLGIVEDLIKGNGGVWATGPHPGVLRIIEDLKSKRPKKQGGGR
jgi:hypothetical protein